MATLRNKSGTTEGGRRRGRPMQREGSTQGCKVCIGCVQRSRDQSGCREAPGIERRGGKLGEMVGSQALQSPEGQSKHFEMYYIGRSVKDFVRGKKQREMQNPHLSTWRVRGGQVSSGKNWKQDRLRTRQGWHGVAGVQTGQREEQIQRTLHLESN